MRRLCHLRGNLFCPLYQIIRENHGFMISHPSLIIRTLGLGPSSWQKQDQEHCFEKKKKKHHFENKKKEHWKWKLYMYAYKNVQYFKNLGHTVLFKAVACEMILCQ